MAFRYSCFISWAHVQGELGITFVESLHKALSESLELHVPAPVYIDRERLTAGYKFKSSLANAMCQSATWVLLFTPRYLKQDFCLRELAAMQVLEERRRSHLDGRLSPEEGLIIPVIFRGKELLPRMIEDSTHYLDFSRFSLADPDISRNPVYIDEIERTAAHIARMCALDADGADDCTTFELPEPALVDKWEPQGFPGHAPAE